jgi:hypothetical protein
MNEGPITTLTVPRLRIPVFVSSPSPENLSEEQQARALVIQGLIHRNKLEWRALGQSDYPIHVPLKEVIRMVQHCAGAVILGFSQLRVTAGTAKVGSTRAREIADPIELPTPWNQLEAGIVASSNLPLLIFKEKGVSGGIFDLGTYEVFVHDMPSPRPTSEEHDDLDTVFQIWAAKVRGRYYGDAG